MELLEVYFSPIDEAHFRVSVKGSRIGQAETISTLPFWSENIDRRITLIKALEAVRFRPEDFNPDEQDWMVQNSLLSENRKNFHPNLQENIGEALYQSLFPRGTLVESLLQKAITLAENNRVQLHIQLQISADILGNIRLSDYPWELMHDGRGFLAQQQVTFSRYINYNATPPNLSSVDKLNVLLISSAASDPKNGLGQLPKEEKLAIGRALQKAGQQGYIRLFELKNPTFKALRTYLTENRGDAAPHVIHFDGHGLFGKRCNNILANGLACRTIHKGVKTKECKSCGALLPEPKGYLVFEDDFGKPEYVSANDIGALLQQNGFISHTNQQRGVALVVLTACQSGLALADTSVFNGVAQNLIFHRIPAVVAMQYSVSVRSAIAFTEQFYRALGEKDPLTMVVSQSREAMGVESNQWYRPVLYLRWHDNEGGQLFAKPVTPPLIPTTIKFKPKVFIPAVSLAITILVFAVRLLGVLQEFELQAFDQMMRLRPSEGIDPRLLLITIDESDIKYQDEKGMKRRGSLSDTALFQLLKQLEPHQPTVIGLDIFRDFSASKDQTKLANKLQNTDNFIAICKGNNPKTQDPGTPPPPEVPKERLGFSDIVVDKYNIVRRHLWYATFNNTLCNTEISFSLQLSLYYLAAKGIQAETTPEGNLKLNTIYLKRLENHAGGYQKLENYGYQILLNYRYPQIATTISLTNVLENNFDPDLVKNRIVLIGVTDRNANNNFYTPYSFNYQPDQMMQGLFLQAQMVSQITSAVLDKRPLLEVLPMWGDVTYISLSALTGGAIVGIFILHKSLKKLLFIVFCFIIFVSYGISFILLIQGYWLPFIPSTLASINTGIIVFLGRKFIYIQPHNH